MVGTNAELADVTSRGSIDSPRRGNERNDLSGLARRGILSLGGAGISAIANLLVIVVVTRGVGRTEAGNLFSATSLFIVAESMCALGTATGLVYFIARIRALGRGYGVHGLLRTALPAVLVASIGVGVVLFLLAPTLADEISSGSSADATLFIRLLAVFLPFATVYDVLVAGTQGFHTMTPTVVIEKIGRPLAQITLLAAAIVAGVSWALPLAWALPYTVGLALIGLSLRRLLRLEHVASGGSAPVVGLVEFWRYTAPRGLAAAAQLSLQRLDIVLVAIYLGAADAAVYTAATRFVVLGQLGSQAVALAVQPKFSELLARSDMVSAKRVYKTSTAWVMAVTWPVHLLVGVLSPIILTMFGSGYQSGRWVVVILAGSMLVASGCGMVTMVLIMAGRTASNLLNVLVALVSNICLNVLLIPVMGIVGAAVAWAVAIVLSNLLPLIQVSRSLGLTPFGRPSMTVGLLALLTLGVVPSMGWLLGGATLTLVCLSAAGLMLYAGGLWRFRSLLELDGLLGPTLRRVR